MKNLFISILAFVLLMIPVKANAQTPEFEDFGSWLSVQANASRGRLYSAIRAEHRTNEKMSNTECWFTMLSAGYKVTNWLSTDLSYEMWNINQAINHRFVACASETLRQGNLSATLREKYEFTITPAGTTYSNFRTRLKVQYAIPDSHFKPYIMPEIFTWGGWKRSLYYVGSEISIGNKSALDLFYMYNVSRNSPSVHTIGVGFYLTL